MKLFDNYLNSISDIVGESRIKTFSNFSGESRMPEYFEKAMLNESQAVQRSNSSNKILIEFDKNQLTSLFGTNSFSFTETNIGSHPDFRTYNTMNLKSIFVYPCLWILRGLLD